MYAPKVLEGSGGGADGYNDDDTSEVVETFDRLADQVGAINTIILLILLLIPGSYC